MKFKLKKGFTLLELMIVVAIVGLLAAVAIPKYGDLLEKANLGATLGNLASLRSAVSIYYGSYMAYPGTMDPLKQPKMDEAITVLERCRKRTGPVKMQAKNVLYRLGKIEKVD